MTVERNNTVSFPPGVVPESRLFFFFFFFVCLFVGVFFVVFYGMCSYIRKGTCQLLDQHTIIMWVDYEKEEEQLDHFFTRNQTTTKSHQTLQKYCHIYDFFLKYRKKRVRKIKKF